MTTTMCECECCQCRDIATEQDEGVRVCAACAEYAVDSDSGDVVCSRDPRYYDDGEWVGQGASGGWVSRPRVLRDV
jgi:hypothetical protein